MKKATILSLFLTLFISSSLLAFGTIDQETRDLDNFSAVSVATGINLILVQGNTTEAVIETEHIDLDEIITKVDGRKLTIKVKNNNWWKNWGKSRKKNITVTLTYKELNQVSASSGARVTSEESLTGDDLDFNTSSGASINLDIVGDDVEADASSGSTLVLRGECASLDASVSSGARIKGSDLEAGNVEASASSGASIKVWAKDDLYAKASSGGSIKYKGKPESLRKKKSSGGSVRQL